MRIVNTVKAAYIDGASRHKLGDKLAGFTTHGKGYRKTYKASTRHARRKLNAALAVAAI